MILRIKRKRGTEPVDALRIGLLLGEESDEADEQVVSAGGSKRRIVEKSREGSGDRSGSGECCLIRSERTRWKKTD